MECDENGKRIGGRGSIDEDEEGEAGRREWESGWRVGNLTRASSKKSGLSEIKD